MNYSAINTLVDAVRRYIDDESHPLLRPFKQNLFTWGDIRLDVPAEASPVAEILARPGLNTTRRTGQLLELFSRNRDSLYWEQSYRREDGVVSEEMLAGYGFVELIGKRGPCVSERIRCGIGVWNAGIVYPMHRHKAEEIYIVLGGSASFVVGSGPPHTRYPEEVVYVSANQPHGFTTLQEPLVVLYLWQNGDLRETSSFS